ncbi:hypothetical protein PsorP6_016786 [Peronosclerospora sorghi]|uniref:Uncharacterized protein n=1 Tax=Peronosclerospora sorghi TaxID=230839 RepID=A0ACC0WDY8_9STRA|nr:hypothetical protein PsorP6_016786 [Peronosclerospora sorghi]
MHARLKHAGTTVDDQVAFLWTLGHLFQATTAYDDTAFVDKVTSWVLAFLSMEPALSSDSSVLYLQVASASPRLTQYRKLALKQHDQGRAEVTEGLPLSAFQPNQQQRFQGPTISRLPDIYILTAYH